MAKFSELQPDVNSDGRIDSSKAIDNLNSHVTPLAQDVRAIIEKSGVRTSLDEFKANALDAISNKINDPDYPKWVKYVEDTVDSYDRFADKNGTISLTKLHDIKQEIANKKVDYLDTNQPALKAVAE